MKKIILAFFIVAGVASVTFVSSCKKKKKNPPPTTSGPQYGSMTDSRDNKTYKTIDIAGQTWMAENLNYSGTLSSGTSVCPSDNEDSCTAYGREYTGDAAKVACPSGWHLPSDAEWRLLEFNVGMTPTDTAKSGSGVERGVAQEIGTKLKKGGSSGFDAVIIKSDYDVQFWTSTMTQVNSNNMQYFRYINYDNSSVYRSYTQPQPTYYKCVRCIKNN